MPSKPTESSLDAFIRDWLTSYAKLSRRKPPEWRARAVANLKAFLAKREAESKEALASLDEPSPSSTPSGSSTP